jgi:hypothetical protein
MVRLLLVIAITIAGCSQRAPGEAGMTSVFTAIEAPVTTESIRDLEARIGAELPATYRNFLRETNGARIPPELRSGISDAPNVQYFFPVYSNRVCADGLSDALGIYETLMNDDSCPPWFLPFARDGIGGIFCISMRSGVESGIYVVYPADQEDDIPVDKREYAQVADSFASFIAQFQIVGEGDRKGR